MNDFLIEMLKNKTTHDRSSIEEPNRIFDEITRLLQDASQLMEFVHEQYDGITVMTVQTGCGETWVKLERKAFCE
jgi:hypothetical protein